MAVLSVTIPARREIKSFRSDVPEHPSDLAATAGQSPCLARTLRGVLGLTLILVLAVCAESSSERAARIQTGVIGLSGRYIISCMGPPEDSEYESDLHGLWVYVRRLDPVAGFRNQPGSGTRSEPPWEIFNRGGSGRFGPSTFDRNREREFLLNPTTTRIAPGYCLLKLEVHDGVVQGFEARGRTLEGMNADTRCALLARHCVE